MNVTFACPHCELTSRAALEPGQAAIACSRCEQQLAVPEDTFDEQGHLQRCAICPSRDLFVRSDFPQRLGVTIVVVGLAASCIPYYFRNIYWTLGILFATALIDLLLYMAVGKVLNCYRCHAQYRGLDPEAEHPAFDLEIHERYRQQEARLAQAEAAQTGAEVGGGKPKVGSRE